MRYVIAIVGLVVLLGSLAGIKAGQILSLIQAGKAMEKAGPPPEIVSAAPAETQEWETRVSAVGSVASIKGVALSNDAPGVVSRIHFDSGATVKAGQVLVELDANVERAQLASIRSRRKLADQSLQRSRALVQSGALPQAQLDSDESALNSASADTAALEAQIARKIVRAPFAGRLGIRAVNLGQYLPPGTTLTVLESAEATSVDFQLPQQELQRIREGATVRILAQEGDAKPLGEGVITAIDPSIAALTRSMKVRASVPDQEQRLRPGMFVNVQVVLPGKRKVVCVPATSVVHAAYGDSVFIVEQGSNPGPDGKPGSIARQQFVRLGDAQGDFVSIEEGVTAGQQVVTAGAFKLRNKAGVVVKNDVKLNPENNPNPPNR